MSGLTFVSPPRCTLETFAAWLAYRRSPAAPLAAELYRILIAYGLDPAVALAFYDHESKCGTLGVARQTRSWGNNRRNLGRAYKVENIPPDKGPFAFYHTIPDALRDWCDLILNGYVGGGLRRGILDTVEKAIPVYAPEEDRNVPAAYIADVRRNVERWAAAGDPWARWGSAHPLPVEQRGHGIPAAWLKAGDLGAALTPEMHGDGCAARAFERGVIVWYADGDRVEIRR